MSRSVAVEVAPLPARSVVLSLLLGAHPDRMRTADIVGVGEYVGVAASTMRVALSRALAAGDLVRTDDGYALSDRLHARQRRQDEGVEDIGSSWDGSWEMAVVVVTGRSVTDRASLRDQLTTARLAELREGVWMRPSNLRRPRDYEINPVLECFTARHRQDPAAISARLWDLDAWASQGEALLAGLATHSDPAIRLATAAQIVRLLGTDPLLPDELAPSDWPGTRLRQAYQDYQIELRGLAALN